MCSWWRLSFQTVPIGGEPTGAGRFGDVRRVDETGSTNADLTALAAAGAPEGVVLVADHQTVGRGRRGRRWDAPPGSSLLASVLFRPPLPIGRLHLVTAAVGLAALDAVADVTGVRPSLKWPNDVVADDRVVGGSAVGSGSRKLAGLLAEAVLPGDAQTRDPRPAVVVGMGMNVRWPGPLPAGLAATATTVAELVGRDVSVDEVLGAWLSAMERRYATLVGGGGMATTAAAHREACSTIGRTVAVELHDRVVEGRAVDIDADGHLVVVDVTGAPHDFAVGDVVHLRPAAMTNPRPSPPRRHGR